MKAETLKKYILQYAMQGKLVAQDPNDEPASELLKRIKSQKEQLIKDGKIKKEKPLPPITEDEFPYELPQGWEWVRLGNIINISSGKFLPLNEMKTEGSIPVYGGNGINGYHDKYLIDKPTLIIGRVGFYCGCVHLSVGKAWVTDNAFITTFSENNININFLKLLLVASDLGKNDNATAQPVVSGKKIYPIVVALPPLAEQQRIVDKLEEILPLVEEYGKNEEILSEMNKKLPKQIRQSILQYAVQGKLVEQNPNDEPASELLKRIKAEKEQLIKEGKIKKEKPLPPITADKTPYELPQGWEWVRLRDVVYNHGQKTPNKTFSYIDIGSIDNKQQSLNINENIVKPEDAPSRARKIVELGDVIYSTVRPYLHNMCIIDKAFSCEPIASTGFAVLCCHKGLSNKYLLYYLLSPDFDNYANNTDNSKGVAYPAINDDKLYKALVPLPPLAEQQRIVTKVEELLDIVDKLT